LRVCIVTASHQNVFFGELLEAFGSALASDGVEVIRSEDHFAPLQDDLVYLFVPHEYLPLTQGDSHPTPRQLLRSVALCTEQPGTHWFEQAAQVAANAGAAVDINELGVEELRRRGVKARHVRLGYVPDWDLWGGEPRERSTDLAFMGGYTDRRALAIARCGRVLQNRRAQLHLSRTFKPHLAGDRWFLAGSRKWEVMRDSKVMLNVHRSQLGYMEWLRVVGAIANGCVVLTEHSLGYQPFVPGEHFVSATFDSLHLALAGLLDDPDRLAEIRDNAYEFLKEEMPLSGVAETLIETLAEVQARPPMSPDPGEPAPQPRPRAPSLSEPNPFAPRSDGSSVMRRALKQTLLDVRQIKRELAELKFGTPEPPDDSHETFGPWESCEPRVTVVVPLYNYSDHVESAISSIARSDYEAFELILIEDCSTDDSAAVAREALEAASWMPSMLIRRGRNRGLAAARNLGLELARGELVMPVDADNCLYPQGMGRLVEAFDAEPDVAFAYGLLETFDHTGSLGLHSWLGWDPVWLRFDNFVDAMAMIRRDRALDVGGYTADPNLFGWEDFALWCAMAQAGWAGTRVPEIIGRYRVGGDSMISTTNIDATAGWAALYRRYPAVFGRSQP
jgi:hypothetical protein